MKSTFQAILDRKSPASKAEAGPLFRSQKDPGGLTEDMLLKRKHEVAIKATNLIIEIKNLEARLPLARAELETLARRGPREKQVVEALRNLYEPTRQAPPGRKAPEPPAKRPRQEPGASSDSEPGEISGSSSGEPLATSPRHSASADSAKPPKLTKSAKRRARLKDRARKASAAPGAPAEKASEPKEHDQPQEMD